MPRLKIRPQPMRGNDAHSRIGQYEGAGRCTSVRKPVWATSSDVAMRTIRWSSVSPYLRYQNSSRWVTTGTWSKLCLGAGEAVIHSIDRASHGSGPGGLQPTFLASRAERKVLGRKISNDSAVRSAPPGDKR